MGGVHTEEVRAHRQQRAGPGQRLRHLHHIHHDLSVKAPCSRERPLERLICRHAQHRDHVAAHLEGEGRFQLPGVHDFQVGQQREVGERVSQPSGHAQAFPKDQRRADLGDVDSRANGLQNGQTVVPIAV